MVHFAGTDALAKNPDTEKLSEILKLPASQELLKRTIEKLYVIATRNDPTNAPGLPPNFVPPLRAALGDIFSSETVLAVRENNGTVAGWALALRMPASRPDKTPELAQFQKGDWLVFGKNTGGSSIHENWILRIKSTGSPVAPLGTNWLQVSISPQFAKVIGWPASVEWPLTDFILNAHTNSIRTEAKFTFPDSLALNLAPWRVPTNSIQDPLVSFTAGRGTAAWLQRLPGFPQLQLPAPPNQFFVWSRSDIPYQTFLAAPLQNAAAQIPRITPGIETFARTNLGPRFFGEFLFVINRNELVWRGLPILVPFLRAAPEPGGDFALLGMMAGIVPRTPNTNPPPAEMLAQFTGRTNVVYYDWEITQTRLQQWWQITRLLAMLANDPARLGPSPGQDWLAAITPLLGNTVTEITAGGPRELHLTRKSHIGLTGIELVLLARWLDNPDFPAWNYPTPKPPAMPPPPPKK
ncbi:MAG: hypothetical protein HY300_11290 [Verrucomicrobia bacterium]|nr:hypothetical protein [Verrucomicrobiota bacterium]